MRNILICLIIMVSFICCRQTSKYDLKLNLQEGKIYTQRIIVESKVKYGNSIDYMLMNISGKIDFKVEKETDSSYEMSAKYHELSLSMKNSKGELLFSSSVDDSLNILSVILNNVCTQNFKVVVNKDGSVKKLTDMYAVFVKIVDKYPDLNVNHKLQLLNLLDQAFGTESVKVNLLIATYIFPDKKVSVGEEWNNEYKFESGMNSIKKNTFVLKEYTDDYAVISVKSVIEVAEEDASLKTDGVPKEYDMNGSLEAQLKIDVETGWVIEGTVFNKIVGEVEWKNDPSIPGGMVMKMEMQNKINISNR